MDLFQWYEGLSQGVRDGIIGGVTTVSVAFVLTATRMTLKTIIVRLKTPDVSSPPGARLLALVDFFYSKSTVENTFKPLIADWQYEYFEALKERRKWKARWISIRYYYSFIKAMGVSKLFSLLKATLASK